MNKLAVLLVPFFALLSFSIATGPALADGDGDGIPDWADNCPGTKSDDIRDSDADGLGNPCDDSPFGLDPPQGEINGNSKSGPLPCHIFTLRIPPPVGDTLPPGSGIFYVFSVFDTGATVLALNPDDAARITFNHPAVPDLLDVRLWGLQAVDTKSLGAPLDYPDAEIEDINVRASTDASLPTLLGGPVTNEVIAYIDYTISVARTYFFGTLRCPAMSFFPADHANLPVPMMSAVLEPFGDTTPSPIDQASRGQRYYIRGMRFINNANSVESPAAPGAIPAGARFLYDSANTTTQISQDAALSLGIDLTAPADDTITIDGEVLNGYIIDRVEIDSDDGSAMYVIKNPLIFVKRPPAFGGAADANIGANFFETNKVLFDGPNSKLGLFRAVDTCPYLANMDTDCDVDGKDLADFSDYFKFGNPAADLNNDGAVNDLDISIIAAEMGM